MDGNGQAEWVGQLPQPGAVRKWLRRAAWCVGGVLALWALAWLALPPLIQWQLQKQASDALGRPVTVGAVEFIPWSVELTLRDVAIAAREAGAAPQLQVPRLTINADWRSLLRLALVVDALDVDAPTLRITRTADGGFDFDDIVERMNRPTDAPPSKGAPRLALYNLQLRDGTVLFDDRPVQRSHRVEGLALGVPFVSTLPADVRVKVEPHLAFRLNGASFASEGEATPFAERREGTIRLRMPDLDIAPYLAYLPKDLPVRPDRGYLALDLSVRFAQATDAAPSIELRGNVGITDGRVLATDGAALAEWRRFEVALADVQPLARRVALGAVRLESPRLALRRDAEGRLAWPRPTTAATTTDGPATTPTSAAWTLRADSFDIVDGGVGWRDASTAPPADLRLAALAISVQRFAWPLEAPLPLKVSAELRAADATVAKLQLDGTAGDRQAAVEFRVEQLRLAALAPYVAGLLRPRLEGVLDMQGHADWATEPRTLKLDVAELRVEELALQDEGATDASVRGLTVGEAQLDLAARHATIGRVGVVQPSLRVERARDRSLNVARWLVPQRGTGEDTRDGARSPSDTAAWQVVIADLEVEAGALRFADATTTPAVGVDIDALHLAVQGFDSANGASPARVTLAAQMLPGAARGSPRERRVRPGRIEWRGTAGLAPLSARGSLRVDRLPLHAFDGYAAEALNASIVRADGGFRGDVTLREDARQRLAIQVAGDALLADVKVLSRPVRGSTAPRDELLNWDTFRVAGLRVQLPAAGKPRVAVHEAEVAGFFSKLVIDENGRFNLRDVAAKEQRETMGPGRSHAAATSAPAAARPPPAPTRTGAGEASLDDMIAAAPPAAGASAPAASASAPAAGAPSPASEPPIDLLVESTRIVNGRIDFTDHFIRPNYSAQLTELNGHVGRFSSMTRESATLELQGRAAGTALLDIRGSLNPTIAPLALDIQAKATDLELAPLSPYAGKYAGYAIERGKLSMDVSYRIDPEGRLEAKNQVILNQLTFGERIESPQATKLPVLLAVALLKDRNGVIDLDLPISGSINDPQFSVFALVLKVIGNLLLKAVTAPFSLLAGGGGQDLSYVEFAAGTAAPTDGARAVLDKVAKALSDRPALKMTVTGAADPAAEREAMQAAALEARLQAERRREVAREGGKADAPMQLSTDDRLRLLREVYRQTDIKEKPRNLIGLAKDLPAAEMERLLRANIAVNEETARELALQRGLAVRDALIAKGLPSERLFLAAPKLRMAGDAPSTAAWTPRVQLLLATN